MVDPYNTTGTMYSVRSAGHGDGYGYIEFHDGRILAFPLTWFPNLASASEEQLAQYIVSPFGVHWPQLDEDISILGLLNGRPNQYKSGDTAGVWSSRFKKAQPSKTEST